MCYNQRDIKYVSKIKKQNVKHSKFKSTKHCESNFDKIISNNSIIEIR